MRNAYSTHLQKTTAEKIISTIPDFVFWDIKKPLTPEEDHHAHPYHPGRSVSNTDFFSMRKNEDWLHRKAQKQNVRNEISIHKRY